METQVETVKESNTSRTSNGFLFKVEYCPNRNIIIIHTRKKFPRADTDPMLPSLLRKEYCRDNQHPLIRSVRRLKGILKIRSNIYQLTIEKAEMFRWDELLPKVKRALKKYFTDGKELEELPAHKPSFEELEELRRHGCRV